MTAQVEAQQNAWATAPGKVIITGEHAVVYGQPALAAAINLTSTAQVTWHQAIAGQQPTLTFCMPSLDLQRTMLVQELQELAKQAQVKHQNFLLGTASLSSLFEQPEDLLLAALGYCITAYDLEIKQSLSVDLQTELLLGGGMGSSASLVTALMASLLSACAVKFDNTELEQSVLVVEHWQHGRSSGLDPAVCVNGGMQIFQTSQSRKISVAALSNLFLVSSGRPQSSTGECVEQVRQKNYTDDYWQQFGCLHKQIVTALQEQTPSDLVEAIKTNHGLLQDLGVVPMAVAQFIGHVEQAGGAGKICGAGSIRGKNGGLLLICGLDETALAGLCQSANYQYWPLNWQPQGVAYGRQ